MKYLLILLLVGVVGFGKPETENRWVGHTIIESPFKQTCLVKIIEATSRDEAELKFDIYIEQMEKELGMKQRDKTAYAVSPLKVAMKIEHELKAFQP